MKLGPSTQLWCGNIDNLSCCVEGNSRSGFDIWTNFSSKFLSWTFFESYNINNFPFAALGPNRGKCNAGWWKILPIICFFPKTSLTPFCANHGKSRQWKWCCYRIAYCLESWHRFLVLVIVIASRSWCRRVKSRDGLTNVGHMETRLSRHWLLCSN